MPIETETDSTDDFAQIEGVSSPKRTRCPHGKHQSTGPGTREANLKALGATFLYIDQTIGDAANTKR